MGLKMNIDLAPNYDTQIFLLTYHISNHMRANYIFPVTITNTWSYSFLQELRAAPGTHQGRRGSQHHCVCRTLYGHKVDHQSNPSQDLE